MNKYTNSFARIYDDIMSGVPYNLWYNYLHDLLDYYHLKPKKVLDLACGTGNMTLRFAQNSYDVVGLDGSEEMLKIAKNKLEKINSNIPLIHSDLRNFYFKYHFDFVFSLFDSLNYIIDYKDLQLVFLNVYKVLKKDGFFIFDMNTPNVLKNIKSGTTMFTGDNYTCFWEDIIDEKNMKWMVELKIYFEEKEGENKPFIEFHEETAYPKEKIVNALYAAGFKYIDVFNAYTFDSGSDRNNRLYYIAFKEETIFKKKIFNRMKKKIKWTIKNKFPFILFPVI